MFGTIVFAISVTIAFFAAAVGGDSLAEYDFAREAGRRLIAKRRFDIAMCVAAASGSIAILCVCLVLTL